MKKKYDVQLNVNDIRESDILLSRSFLSGSQVFISIGADFLIYFANLAQAQLFVGKIVQDLNRLNSEK